MTMAGTEVKPEIENVHYIWSNESPKLLSGLLLAVVENTSADRQEDAADLEKNVDPGKLDLSVSSQTSCSTCGAEFSELKEQREHFKSDWHRFNLKQKLKGLSPVSEDQFEEVFGDISSISGTGSSDDSSSSDDEDKSAVDKVIKRKVLSKKPESDSDDDESYHIEGVGRRHPRVFLKNTDGDLLSIYRCVIHSKKNRPDTAEALISLTESLPSNKKWAIFMTAGGHFAGAIFDREKTVVHKTFHRYVVRAKRGTAQSSRDKQGNAPKSGGASLRRYNEAALAQEVQELIGVTWAEEIKNCGRIFLRAPSFNRQIFFSGKTRPLDKNDPRIRMIPFQTRRPTYKELLRVHNTLGEIKIHDRDMSIFDFVQTSPKKTQIFKAPSSNKAIPEPIKEDSSSSESENEENTILSMQTMTLDTTELAPFAATKKRRRGKKPKTKSQEVKKEKQLESYGGNIFTPEYEQIRNDMYTACKVDDKVKLAACIQNVSGDAACNSEGQSDVIAMPTIVEMLNASFGEKSTTLLHVACRAGSSTLISLLLDTGADPTKKDHQGQLPYVVAANKETRNEFRRFMAKQPDRYDYTVAQVPGPLTDEMESEKKAREAEKKKAQRKARKERQKEQKAIEANQREEERERQRFLNLSDREKRALAAEKRLTAQKESEGAARPVLSRCWQCAEDMTGKIPFEYFDYKFCSPKCLKDHKMANKT